MPYTPDFHAGGEGTVVVGGVDWNVVKWSATISRVNEVVTTTGDYSASAGVSFQRRKTTQVSCKFQIEAIRDGSNDFFPAISITATELTTMVLKSWTGHVITMPLGLLDDIQLDNGGVTGVPKLSISGMNNGVFTVT